MTFAALACAVASAGCGSEDPVGPKATPTASIAATPTPDRDPAVDLDRPEAGATVSATPVGEKGLRATVVVEGFAPADATLGVTAACDANGCRQRVPVGANGHWSVRLTVTASRARPTATIRISSSTPGTPVRRRITLRAKRISPQPQSTPRPTASATPRPPTASNPPRRLVLVGDSLAVGIESLLPSLLPGWTVTSHALTGRPLADGMRIIAQTELSSAPTVLAVSLFTNDDPRATAALEAAVRRSMQLVGGHGCAAWATIVRPPVGGVSYGAANSTLRSLANDPTLRGRMLLVPWATLVAAQPALVGSDGVHATPAGYQARAQLYARAAQSCRG